MEIMFQKELDKFKSIIEKMEEKYHKKLFFLPLLDDLLACRSVDEFYLIYYAFKEQCHECTLKALEESVSQNLDHLKMMLLHCMMQETRLTLNLQKT